MSDQQIRQAPDGEMTADPWIEPVLQGMGLPAVGLERLRTNGTGGLWRACAQAGLATDADILDAYSRRFGVAIADLTRVLAVDANSLLPQETARRLRVLPLRQEGRVLVAACSRPMDLNLETAIMFATGLRASLLLAAPAAMDRALDSAYPRADEAKDLVGSVGILEDGEGLLREVAAMDDSAASTISTTDLVNALLVKAIRERASDVHIQPHDASIGIRYRVDGTMLEIAHLPRGLLPSITSRLKILANLDIADRMRPQDGRAQVQLSGRKVDLRISTLPVGRLGEKTVIRILDSGDSPLTMSSLGFTDAELRYVEQIFRMREGLVLVTGPTGSGKTTTLYSALRLVQETGANIVTVEDPIEYRMDGITQAQVNEKAGLTFATVLRSILRQDPDAVLVGEIRDRETAEVALQASMTGHLVLSTLHTNDSASTIMRLADMGVDLTVLATSLRAVMAQRLVRRVCPECRVPCELTDLAETQQNLLAHLPDLTLYLAAGCPACLGIGYRGRLVVPEIALISADIEQAITQRADLHTIVDLCRRNGTVSLWEAGLDRVARGLTTLNELLDNITPPIADVQATRDQQEDVDAIFRAASPSRKGPPAVTKRVPADLREDAPRPGLQLVRPRSTRVLVVDEDASARRELRGTLEGAGFIVNEAADGEAALEYVERLKPDVILLELALPKLDGIGVLRAMQSMESCRTAALVLTVQADPEIGVWAMELGALDVLTKPVNPQLLARRLTSLLADAAA